MRNKPIKKRIIAVILTLSLCAAAASCARPAENVPPEQTKAASTAAPAASSIPEPTAAPADLSMYEGHWDNEAGGFKLKVKNGQYTLIEPGELAIWAGDCKAGEAGGLRLGEYSAALSSGGLTIEGIDGVFAYTLTYEGGAGEEFLGDWENDTTGFRLTIARDNCVFYNQNSGGEYHSSSYATVKDGLKFGGEDEDAHIRLAPDGGLKADGYDGTFYRVGLGKGAPSPLAPYLGEWENADAQISLSIQEGDYLGGAYFLTGDDLSMSMGGCWIEDGVLMIGDDQTITLNADGTLSVWSIEGAFKKTGEYMPPSPSPTPEPIPQASAKPKREHPDMRYGVIESSPEGVIFLEPQTGSRIAFPGVFDGCVKGDMSLQYGNSYLLINSPDPVEDFNLLGSEIAAMASVAYETLGADSIEDVIKHLNDPAFDSFEILEQTQNHVRICDYQADSENETIATYKWAYLFDDGSVLSVSIRAKELEASEYEGQTVIELGAQSAQSEAALASGGPVAAPPEGEETIGFGMALGAWYCEDEDLAVFCAPDGSAVLVEGESRYDATFSIYHGGYMDSAPQIRVRMDENVLRLQVYGKTLYILDMDDNEYIFVYIPPEELPERLAQAFQEGS